MRLEIADSQMSTQVRLSWIRRLPETIKACQALLSMPMEEDVWQKETSGY